MKPPTWQATTSVASADLVEARLMLHWAARIVATVGTTLAPPKDDWSHASLEWSPSQRALIGSPAPSTRRAALRPEDGTLLVVNAQGGIVDTFPLAGRTTADALAWLTATVEAGKPLVPKEGGIEHAVTSGAPFSTKHAAAYAALAHWYANAHRALTRIDLDGAALPPIRCWPHHFDIAFMLVTRPAKGAAEARSIGMGMSPGDDSFPEPYWYILPWPKPDVADLPSLEETGEWHTEGWVGAVLPASREEAHTESGVSDFFAVGFEAARELVEN